MTRSIPLDRLPEGFKKFSCCGIYSFYKSKESKGIIWKRDDKDMFIRSLEMSEAPTEEKFMFWHDPSYYEDFIKEKY